MYQLAGGVLAAKSIGTLTYPTEIIDKVTQMNQDDGQFSDAVGSSVTSIDNAHLVLDILVAYTVGNYQDKAAIDKLFEKLFALLPSGNTESITDATLVASLSKLSEKKLRLVGNRLVAVADGLLDAKNTDDLSVACKVLEGLKIVSSYKAQPAFTALERTLFPVGDKASQVLQLNVVDVFGNPLPVNSIEVVAIKNVAKDLTLFQGMQMVDGTLDFSSEGLVPGRYIFHAKINLANRPNPLNFQGHIAITDSVQINDVKIAVSESKQVNSADMQAVSTQNSVFGLTASALAAENVVVQYTLNAKYLPDKLKKPHQSFVRLSMAGSGISSYTVAKMVATDDGSMQYSAVISLVNQVEKFSYKSGEYSVAILVADVTYDSPLEYLIGTIALKFPDAPSVSYPLYAKSLLHASDITLSPLPEIVHQMRPPAKRASNFMAGLFTILTFVPLLVFLGFLLKLGPNVKNLNALSSVVFMICILALTGLYVCYWFSLEGFSFYQTIKYLCFLFPITIVVGRYSLSAITEARLKRLEEEKNK